MQDLILCEEYLRDPVPENPLGLGCEIGFIEPKWAVQTTQEDSPKGQDSGQREQDNEGARLQSAAFWCPASAATRFRYAGMRMHIRTERIISSMFQAVRTTPFQCPVILEVPTLPR